MQVLWPKRTGILYNWGEASMPSETTYSRLRENLATVLDQVVDQQDTVIVRRRGGARCRVDSGIRTRRANGNRAFAAVPS